MDNQDTRHLQRSPESDLRHAGVPLLEHPAGLDSSLLDIRTSGRSVSPTFTNILAFLYDEAPKNQAYGDSSIASSQNYNVMNQPSPLNIGHWEQAHDILEGMTKNPFEVVEKGVDKKAFSQGPCAVEKTDSSLINDFVEPSLLFRESTSADNNQQRPLQGVVPTDASYRYFKESQDVAVLKDQSKAFLQVDQNEKPIHTSFDTCNVQPDLAVHQTVVQKGIPNPDVFTEFTCDYGSQFSGTRGVSISTQTESPALANANSAIPNPEIVHKPVDPATEPLQQYIPELQPSQWYIPNADTIQGTSQQLMTPLANPITPHYTQGILTSVPHQLQLPTSNALSKVAGVQSIARVTNGANNRVFSQNYIVLRTANTQPYATSNVCDRQLLQQHFIPAQSTSLKPGEEHNSQAHQPYSLFHEAAASSALNAPNVPPPPPDVPQAIPFRGDPNAHKTAQPARKRKAMSSASANGSKAVRVIAPGEDKPQDEVTLRKKTFDVQFLASGEYRMVNPLAESGFFLYRTGNVALVKCCDRKCEMQHLVPNVFKQKANEVTWHREECRFSLAKNPCIGCVRFDGICRGCGDCKK